MRVAHVCAGNTWYCISELFFCVFVKAGKGLAECLKPDFVGIAERSGFSDIFLDVEMKLGFILDRSLIVIALVATDDLSFFRAIVDVERVDMSPG
ncbi:hypothetical protein EB776_08195 [Trueperella pyogenes]|nr:hypothetical protein EB776_08195 [Trueperella pyogenes]